MACSNRTMQLGVKSGIRLYKFRSSTINRLGASANSYSSSSSNSSDYQLGYEQISPNEKRVYPFDTHALIRSLEAQGVPTKQAEAITSALTLFSSVNSEYISQNFVSKAEMEKFKSEVQSSLDHLRNDDEKMRGELRYEMDKVTAGQRLDLNLEKRHTRDELTNQRAEINNLDNKIDREIQAVKAEAKAEQVASKYELFKYGIGFFISASAVCVGLVRIFMTKQ